MVKGNQATQTSKATAKYIGLAKVQIRAVNPTRAQLNKLLGKEDTEDNEISYLSQDQDGNDRVRLSFWMYEQELDTYFVHSFNLTNKVRLSKDGVKTQYVNNTCITAWSDEDSNLPEWFTKFIDSKSREDLGEKKYRKALLGEEELAILLRSWLGRLKWNDPNCSVQVDTKALFGGDYSELQSLIDGDYDTPFIALLGVRTDENDSEKQYQQVYGKSFLPKSFAEGLELVEKRGDKAFGTPYAKKIWNKFDSEVNGDYGFSAYFELCPVKEYDKNKDLNASPKTRPDVMPTNSKY